MPIKGEINALFYENCVEKMTVGQTGYISSYDLILTKRALCIEGCTPIILKEDYSEDLYANTIPITRIGAGLTEDDFEVDFSNLDAYDFRLQSDAVFFLIASEDAASYIIFSNPPLIIGDSVVVVEIIEPIESLQERYQQAIAEENYELAGQLMQKIKERK